jgi:hypothetical protein
VLNSTIAGNLAHIGGAILVVQDLETAATSLVLENSLIAINGFRECAITGSSIGVAFAGNLIVSNADGSEFEGRTFVGCEGVVASTDPQLGPLQYNQGATPTMAIAPTSPARNAADPATSLLVDQRKQPRPANGGYDIGAFELCLEGLGKLEQPCLILSGIEDPGGFGEAVQLTLQVSPAGGGTTIPAPGIQQVPKESVVGLAAKANAGFRFTGWTQNVTNPGDASTTVVMSLPQTVTALFAPCQCATDVTASIGITYGPFVQTKTFRYEQTVTLTNKSAATIVGPISLVFDRLDPTVTVLSSAGGTELMLPSNSPYVNIKTPLAPGESVAVQLRFQNRVDDVVTYTPRVLAGKGSR